MITDAEGRTFTFDAENKQTQVKDANDAVIGTYSYDGDGKRVKKAATTENIVFVYDAAGKLVEEYSGSTLQTAYVYAGSRLLTTETATGTSYLTSDHLGSPRINTDATGNVTARHDYMPFGEEIFSLGGRTTGLGDNSDNGRKKFTGYERDNETDLDYAKARMFGNPIGRFTSPDPLLSSGRIENPQTWNRYIYVLNNPLALTDPTGLWEWGEEAGGSATNKELETASKDKTLSKDARKKASKALKFRNNFKAALDLISAAAASNKLTQKQKEAISRAVNSYGKEGDGNNVIVSFASQGSGIGANTDGTLGDLVFVSFRFEKKGKDLALDIAHEGSHVADNQDFDLIASLGMCGANSANITLLDSERKAYGVTSFAAQALGVSPVFDYPNETKYYIWNSGWKEADRDRKRSAGIENLLRDKSPYAGSIFYQNRFSDIEKDR